MLLSEIQFLLTLQPAVAMRDFDSTGAYFLICYTSCWKSELRRIEHPQRKVANTARQVIQN